MKDVVLPQALKISMPATIGFLVQLIKAHRLQQSSASSS